MLFPEALFSLLKYFQNCALQTEHLALKALHKKKERKYITKKHFSPAVLHLLDYFLIAPPSPSLTKRFRPLVEEFTEVGY